MGGLIPVTAVIRVRATTYTELGSVHPDEMPFPPLPETWELLKHRSNEGLPSRIAIGKDAAKDTWERIGEFVLQTAVLDAVSYEDLRKTVTAKGSVASHLLTATEEEEGS
jgi:hypothetical protein